MGSWLRDRYLPATRMILGDREAHVEIGVARTEPPTPYTAGGDVLVAVRVSHRSFAGAADAWVLAPTWAEFIRELTALEQRRQGSAQVESMSPGELRLRIFSTDRAGHMAVEGFIGVRGPLQEWRLEFSPIAFDPSLLPALVGELASGASAV